LLSIVVPFYGFLGYFIALFGDSSWFNDNAFSAISSTWELPAYTTEGFNTLLTAKASS
jgi:hypothetical protein